jgi:glycosyltransferase involved in cell wall biosynthesis
LARHQLEAAAAHDNVWVVVPAYNEADVIAGVISRVRVHGYRIVCVDDGSSDDIANVAAACGSDVLVHPFNLGQGAALQTGIEYALLQDADHVCTLDADGQHDADDLPRLLAALDEHGADFAVGSRFLGNAVDMPAGRRALLRAATLFTRLTTGLPLTDTHNGIRAMTRRAAELIQLRQERMAHASEILMQIRKCGLAMIEVPVTVSYTAYSLRKGQTFSSALRVLADLAAGLLRS